MMKTHAHSMLSCLGGLVLPVMGWAAEAPDHLKGLTKLSPKRVDLDYQMSLLCFRPTNPRKPSVHSKSSILVYANDKALDYRRKNPSAYDYPVGTVFLKEKYPNKKSDTPHLATVMKRVGQKGGIGDWEFSVHSLPGGNREVLNAKDAAACADCHGDFKARGFVSRYTDSVLVSLLRPQKTNPDEQAQRVRPHADSKGFLQLAAEAERLRDQRLLSEEDFAGMARMKDTLVLDARSRRTYAVQHVSGAVNLPYTEFTPDSLSKVIPSADTAVLIYCSNNINYPQPPKPGGNFRVGGSFKGQNAALTIPTFITLYGYGYRNLYQLGPVVNPDESVIKFVEGD